MVGKSVVVVFVVVVEVLGVVVVFCWGFLVVVVGLEVEGLAFGALVVVDFAVLVLTTSSLFSSSVVPTVSTGRFS